MKVTEKNITAFMDKIQEPRYSDIKLLVEMMQKVTKRDPELWGTIIGFGSLHYVYESGLSGDMPILGLANRKQAITLYLSYDIESYSILNKLGKYITGKSCLYIKKLSDIDLNILEQLMITAYKDALNYTNVTLNY